MDLGQIPSRDGNTDAWEDDTAVPEQVQKRFLRLIATQNFKLFTERVEAFLNVDDLYREAFPNGKILVFSPVLKSLDLIVEALRQRYGVEGLRYR